MVLGLLLAVTASFRQRGQVTSAHFARVAMVALGAALVSRRHLCCLWLSTAKNPLDAFPLSAAREHFIRREPCGHHDLLRQRHHPWHAKRTMGAGARTLRASPAACR